MHIPMTDLKVQNESIKTEIAAGLERVINSGRFILGPEVEAFEQEIANYCGTKFAIGVASGTDALLIALKACGVKAGDEVITTPFTFISTAMAASHCGATPVFADIDPETYNIDPNQIEARISSKTRAIIPVHLFGQPADMDAIMYLAIKHGLKVIEDCAQALSGEYHGRKAGSIGDTGILSFFPAKNLGAYGDGGMIVTSDPQIAEASRLLRQHGAMTSYYHSLPGFNSRLDAMQAAVLRVKLKHLDEWSNLRRQRAGLYNNLLTGINGIEIPVSAEGNLTSANYYTLRLTDRFSERNELRAFLAKLGIETNIYYPVSLHLQEVYKNLGYHHGDFPESEAAQEQVLSLPMYPELTEDQVREVVTGIREYFEQTSRISAPQLSSIQSGFFAGENQ